MQPNDMEEAAEQRREDDAEQAPGPVFYRDDGNRFGTTQISPENMPVGATGIVQFHMDGAPVEVDVEVVEHIEDDDGKMQVRMRMSEIRPRGQSDG